MISLRKEKVMSKKPVTVLDLSLKNPDVYRGCGIKTVAGRDNLTTPVDEAIEIVGNNLAQMSFDSERVVLTGPMAIWAYLIAFHTVVHVTKSVYYRDARGEYLIAQHG